MSESASRATLDYTCPRCKAPLRAQQSDMGTRRKCPKCSKAIKVPGIPTGKQKHSRTADSEAQPVTSAEMAQAITPTGPKFSVTCQQCQNQLMVTPDQVGESVLCQDCLETVIVPESTTTPSPDAAQEEPITTPAATLTPTTNPETPAAEPTPAPTPADHGSETFIPESFTVICSVCGTRLGAQRNQIGALMKCPDCFAMTKVREPKPVKKKQYAPLSESSEMPSVALPIIPPNKTAGATAIAEAQQELQEEIEATAERESKSRLQNLFGFLFFPEMLLRVCVFSLALISTWLMLSNAASLTGDWGEIALGMILRTGGGLLGILALLIALPTIVVIISETAHGHYEVRGLPDLNVADSFGQTLYAMISLLACLIPYAILHSSVGLVIPDPEQTQLVIQIVCASLFPLLLLSALESNSPIILWSNLIYESIVTKPSWWLEFWLTSFILFATRYLLSTFVVAFLPDQVQIVVNSVLWIFVGCLYCRAIGLLAWQASKIFAPNSK